MLKQTSAMLTCGLAAAIIISSYEGASADVQQDIANGQLVATDTVAYLLSGLEDGAEFHLPGGNVGTVSPVGMRLDPNAPAAFEISFGNIGPSQIIRVEQKTPCIYIMESLSYNRNRKLWPDAKPEVLSVELDFSNAVEAFIVNNSTPTAQIVGLSCTPREKGEGSCDMARDGGFISAASDANLKNAFAYFQEKFCPRQN